MPPCAGRRRRFGPPCRGRRRRARSARAVKLRRRPTPSTRAAVLILPGGFLLPVRGARRAAAVGGARYRHPDLQRAGVSFTGRVGESTRSRFKPRRV
jgi:hypothetical protein